MENHFTNKYNHFINSHSPNRYSELDQDSQRILSFSIQPGLNTHVYKSHSPFLESTCTISPSKQASAGLLYTSNTNAYKSWLTFGKIYQDLHAETVLAYKHSPLSLWILSGMHLVTLPKNSFVTCQYLRSGGSWTHQFSLHSQDTVLGWNSLYSYSPNYSLGYEVYATLSEKSLGASVGWKYKDPLSEWVLVMIGNPIMGYLSSSCIAPITPNLRIASKYDFNVYSLESDLSFGTEYTTSLKNGNSLLKFKWSFKRGFGMAIEISDSIKRFGFGFEIKSNDSMNPLTFLGLQIEL